MKDRSLRLHTVPTRAEQVRTAVEIVAIIAAGAWALYTFVYEQRIKPLSEAAAFTVSTPVDQSPVRNGVVFLTIHKRIENTGRLKVRVPRTALARFEVSMPASMRV